MKKYLPVLLLSGLFSMKSYAQSTVPSSNDLNLNTVSVDEDAMNWELSYDFMGIDKGAKQATCTGDVTDPVIFCPQDFFVQATSSCQVFLDYYPYPSVSDNCPGVSVQCYPSPWNFFSIGTTTVTCIATDGSNNTADCTFDIVVFDNVPPTITCPQDLFIQATNTCGSVVDFYPFFNDNCPGVSYQCFPPPGTLFSNGTTTVTCITADASNNTANCMFNVFISSNIPPTIACPQDLFVQATNTNSCGTVVDYPFPSVNCPGVAIQCNPPPTSFFSLGTTTVTCTATDGANNTAVCTFDVAVSDNTPPVMVCPNDVVVQPDPNTCTAVVAWADPIVFDNCSINYVIDCFPPSGSTFSAGTSTVYCAAFVDNFYVAGTCQFDVVVTDDCFANCPPTITLNNTTATGLHHAQNSVTAINTITTGTNTAFKAGNVIELYNGFTSPSSTNFSAEIEDCTPNFAPNGDQN